MSQINTSPKVLREFAKEIRNFIEGQEEVIGRLVTSYRNIGSEWNDVQYKKFGECLENIIKSVKSSIPECEMTAKNLEQKAKILDEYYK